MTFAHSNPYLIIGAGHFGVRAAKILTGTEFRGASVWVVEKVATRLESLAGLPVERVRAEGVGFLVDHSERLPPSTTLIPAVPLHLAYEWLRGVLGSDRGFEKIKIPPEIESDLPHTWEGPEGTLLVSYADFRCPDDCPEPAGYCTVTRSKRGIPLYDLLRRVAPAGYHPRIIRSRQIAPGLGGYRLEDLRRLSTDVRATRAERWLIGTACKCHGMLTAFRVQPIPSVSCDSKSETELRGKRRFPTDSLSG
jgi:hypothetical protein